MFERRWQFQRGASDLTSKSVNRCPIFVRNTDICLKLSKTGNGTVVQDGRVQACSCRGLASTSLFCRNVSKSRHF